MDPRFVQHRWGSGVPGYVVHYSALVVTDGARVNVCTDSTGSSGTLRGDAHSGGECQYAPAPYVGVGEVLTTRPGGFSILGRATEQEPFDPHQREGAAVAVEQDTRLRILVAAKAALLDVGYANLSTRRIADAAGVPLSQIHYHFGSKQNLMLAVLDRENQQRLSRQAAMYQADLSLWKQWQQACDFFDDDLESGYVRVLMEMTAAGWSNPEIAEAVSAEVRGWFDLLAEVARRASERLGIDSPFTPAELAALAGLPFLGAETLILLGMDEARVAARSALRKIGELLRTFEEPPKPRRRR